MTSSQPEMGSLLISCVASVLTTSMTLSFISVKVSLNYLGSSYFSKLRKERISYLERDPTHFRTLSSRACWSVSSRQKLLGGSSAISGTLRLEIGTQTDASVAIIESWYHTSALEFFTSTLATSTSTVAFSRRLWRWNAVESTCPSYPRSFVYSFMPARTSSIVTVLQSWLKSGRITPFGSFWSHRTYAMFAAPCALYTRSCSRSCSKNSIISSLLNVDFT